MVLPLALAPFATKIGLVGAGVAGGYLASTLLGGKKEASAVATAGTVETHAPYEQYRPIYTHAPTTSQVYAPSVMYQIESPGAYMSKKDVAAAEATPSTTVSPQYADPRIYDVGAGAEAGIGTDLVPIAIIGAVAVIGYGYLSKEKS